MNAKYTCSKLCENLSNMQANNQTHIVKLVIQLLYSTYDTDVNNNIKTINDMQV